MQGRRGEKKTKKIHLLLSRKKEAETAKSKLQPCQDFKRLPAELNIRASMITYLCYRYRGKKKNSCSGITKCLVRSAMDPEK